MEKFKAVVSIDARKVRRKGTEPWDGRGSDRGENRLERTIDRTKEKKTGERKEEKNASGMEREGNRGKKERIKKGQGKGDEENEKKKRKREKESHCSCSRGHCSISRGIEAPGERINCVKVCTEPVA